MADQLGEKDIRKNNISKTIRGILAQKLKLMRVLGQESSSAMSETYYTEDNDVLTAGGETFGIRGVARSAAFPNVDPAWTKNTGFNIKWAAETTITIEDDMTSEIGVKKRAIFKIAQAIKDDIDNYIYDSLTGATGILTAGCSATWDNATVANRQPILDINSGIEAMDDEGVDILDNGFLLLNNYDYKYLMLNEKIANRDYNGKNGSESQTVRGLIAGLTPIKSKAVDDDEFMIIKKGEAAAWMNLQDLTSSITVNDGIDSLLKAWQFGHVQIHQPKKIYVGTNTQT